ncbi:MAG: helix-turn-helix domain-containing protein [Bacteroidaceae bacterium]|nr:helix-turn-helix domain-containing protein [Bacteroidaceae bacterium]
MYHKDNLNMNFNFSSLQSLLESLENKSKVHINVVCKSNANFIDKLSLDLKHRIHQHDFCDYMKSTAKGFKHCINCKRLSINKATKEKKRFEGHCINGLYEIVQPVVISGKVDYIIYIGGIVMDNSVSNRILEKSCMACDLDYSNAFEKLKNAEHENDISMYYNMADIIESYIRMLIFLYPSDRENKVKLNYSIAFIKDNADYYFSSDISIKQLAITCHYNEKYLGRLFKKQTGYSFDDYINNKRLEYSEQLILNSDRNITDIAIAAGFNNVTYFNRLFLKKNGVSPTEFRKNPTGII